MTTLAAVRSPVPNALPEPATRARGGARPERFHGEVEASMLFVDIRGYTGYAERLAPSEIHAFLTRYARVCSEVITAAGGEVVELVGDGLMAAFRDPARGANKEEAAVAAARELVRALAELGFSVGIGVSTGPVFSGEMRVCGRPLRTMVGNATNLAARLQELSRRYRTSILIDAPTQARAGSLTRGFQLRPRVPIPGFRRAQHLFMLPDPKPLPWLDGREVAHAAV